MREWRFMLRQRDVVMLLLCSLLLSGFAITSGINEVDNQRSTIERLLKADALDGKDVLNSHADYGSVAYYRFHLTYSEPSALAFAALGERDIYPWKHRIRMLALEGQIYESDTANAELAQTGKFDFVFVISALAPLLVILLFHDLFANERANGRYDLLLSTARSPLSLWGPRSLVRFVSLFVILLLPFWFGAFMQDVGLSDTALISLWCGLYLLLWAGLSIWWGRNATSSPRVASGLIGIWVLLTFVIPTAGDVIINQSMESVDGGDIVLAQREAVNAAWDKPIEATMGPFTQSYPQWKGYVDMQSLFEWKWFYAFQQMGDESTAELSLAYRKAASKKYEVAGYVSMLALPHLLQRKMTRLAQTDAIAAFEYERQVRDFHRRLRHFYYPLLFKNEVFSVEKLADTPEFVPMANHEF
ncbi:DUF3526 domain-containing protein [Paraglaciecola sp. 20A4]|uniref:DUF3526 domain-containing protein n=1 Tax=Paraglaciecola sp. 20A4 TaxID=2687288 RepID=UPI001F0E87BE|nr:DUF3526 domain-containing protein [Paraglaciecola sp. 20A4]